MKKKIELGMALILLLAAGFLSRKGAMLVNNTKSSAQERCIVIDAGHGGDDPGKIGIHGEKEKEINLIIAKKVASYLEANDVKVYMTRKSEAGLHDPGSSNQKVSDMRNRCSLIEEYQPKFTISIHQNSYPDEAISGAQCFYYGQSEESRKIAETMQESLRQRLDPENHRQAKANESYYLLKKTVSPTVIVECGFLSNDKEATLLSQEEYQDKVAWAIYMGIMQSLAEDEQGKKQAS